MRIKSTGDYVKNYLESISNVESYWNNVAENFTWEKNWETTLKGSLEKQNVEWFSGGQLNITSNCIDRHFEERPNDVAVVWVANDPSKPAVEITYKDLYENVCSFANVLKSQGAKKGDRICFYMGMVPELLYGILASARIGAVHSVVFGGFSADSLANRISDCKANILVCSDISWRGAKAINLKEIADSALSQVSCIRSTIVVSSNPEKVELKPNQALYSHLKKSETSECEAEVMDSEDPLFILYTSGSTGKPKGLVHTTGGYMVYAAHTFENVFQAEKGDIFWCTADIGWITGHTYLTYGPLLNGVTTVMFEGVPSWPDYGRFWDIVEKIGVSHFYTAPTAIRSLACQGDDFVNKYDLSSLKVLGTVGEPINDEAWKWYYEVVGKEKCPIVDTWWQTETGGIMISSLAGITESVPCEATIPLPGVQPVLMDKDGKEISEINGEGRLCIKAPWPGMARTIYGDHERYKETYLSAFDGYYFTGDGAKRNSKGHYRITGRVDDVVIVSGHNIGTAEVEDAINEHDLVSESAVIGVEHEVKGLALKAYVVLNAKDKSESSNVKSSLGEEIRGLVSKKIGPIAKPDFIEIASELPKTRSGKIMRRILRKISAGESSSLGDTSTLLNPGVVDQLLENSANIC